MVVVIGGEKGGTGKTTIATNLAAYLAVLGHDVLMVDADPQHSASNWVQRRNDRREEGEGRVPEVKCVQATGDIRKTVADLARRYAYVLVDTGGRNSAELRSALLVADVFYAPVRASQPDLETMPTVKDAVEQARIYLPDLQARSLLSMAPTNPVIKEAESAMEFLGEYADLLPMSKVVIRDRKVYRDASIEGLGVVEMANLTAKAELEMLGEEIFG